MERHGRMVGGGARTLGGYVAAAAIAIAVLALAPMQVIGQAQPSGSTSVTQVQAAGQALYLQGCAACHGLQGEGTANGPNIQQAGAALADFVLRTGRMPLAAPATQSQRGKPAYDDAQIQALVAYVSSFGAGPPIPDVVTGAADLPAGRNLYVTSCAACHGPAGGGGAVGGGFVAPALDQATAQQIAEAVLAGPGPMPRFSFSPDQLRDLTGYVVSIRSEPHPGGADIPTVGPVTEGFIAALALVALLVVARWIGVRQGRERG